MTRPATMAISPFFIVSNVGRTIAFYRGKLGFEATLQEPVQKTPMLLPLNSSITVRPSAHHSRINTTACAALNSPTRTAMFCFSGARDRPRSAGVAPDVPRYGASVVRC